MNKEKKDCLALPGIFLPNNSTITILSYKLLRMLDYKIDVLSMKTEYDDSLRENIESDPKFSKFTLFYSSEYKYALFERSNKNVLKIFLNNQKYVRNAVKKSKKKKYDIVFSLSLPNFSHMAGYKVKKANTNIKWIASFSDPIIGNPMHNFMKTEYKSIILKIGHFISKKVNNNDRYQKLAFKYADKLVFVSQEQRDFMIKGNKVLLEKSVIVPFTYIKEWPIYQKLITGQSSPGNKPKRIGHFGNIYGARRIDSLIDGIKKAKKKVPNLNEYLVIEHYGNLEQRQRKLIIDNNVQDIFIINERIPYAKTLEIMNEVDILLMLDVYIDENEVQPFMPSKFIEYFLTNKLILSIANEKSPIYRHLINTSHVCVKPKGNDISNVLIDIMEKTCYIENDYEIYENEFVMNKTLIEVIEKK